MNYKWLLFDADGTLFDFEKAESMAFQRSVTELGYSYKPDYLTMYKQVNKQLWDAFEQGKVAQDVLKIRRFERFFEVAGITGNAEHFSQRYVTHLAEGNYLLDGAENLVKMLSKSYRLLIITNGLKEVQRPRFERSSIYHYFESIIVSGEIGAAKPGAKIFDAAFATMEHPKKDEALIIGDSLTSDMAGGINYGIDTCWYNPQGQENQDSLAITYEIDNLLALRHILTG
ncbi:MAG: YjjG family noncanonical pyrimidine nucleotidase [Chloroflexota bacterium]